MVGRPFEDQAWGPNYKSDWDGHKDRYRESQFRNDPETLASTPNKSISLPELRPSTNPMEPTREEGKLVPTGVTVDPVVRTEFCNAQGECGLAYAHKVKTSPDVVYTYEVK